MTRGAMLQNILALAVPLPVPPPTLVAALLASWQLTIITPVFSSVLALAAANEVDNSVVGGVEQQVVKNKSISSQSSSSDNRVSVHIETAVFPAGSEEAEKMAEDHGDGGDWAECQTLDDCLAPLVDTWWKMTLWALAAALMFIIYLYITRCCYLLWDCCTDSYWGCCPRRRGCKRFMLLKCCKPKTPGHEDFDTDTDDDAYLGGKYEYQVCRTRAPRAATVETIECGGEEGGGLPGGATSAGSSTDVDFTLKNVEDVIGAGNGAVDSDQSEPLMPDESRWKDASLTISSAHNTGSNRRPNKRHPSNSSSKHSYATTAATAPLLPPINPSSTASTAGNPLTAVGGTSVPPPVTTSTPRKGSAARNSEFPFTQEEQVVLVDSANAEALPHLKEGHYFNLLNVFGIGSGKAQYSIVGSGGGGAASPPGATSPASTRRGGRLNSSSTRKDSSSSNRNAGNNSSLANHSSQMNDSKDTTTSTSDRGTSSPDGGNPASAGGGHSDFLLSNSFSNVSYQRYGLHIEEGQSGKYHPLPEAQSELLPPDKFVQLQQNFPLRTYTTHAEKKALIASRRRSRSMDTFSKLHSNNGLGGGGGGGGHHGNHEIGRSRGQIERSHRDRVSTRSHTDVLVHSARQSYDCSPSPGSSDESRPLNNSTRARSVSRSQDVGEISKVTIHTNQSKFAIYSVPVKNNKKSTKTVSSPTSPGLVLAATTATSAVENGTTNVSGHSGGEADAEESLPASFRKPPRVPQPNGNHLPSNGIENGYSAASIPRKSPSGKRSKRGMKIIDSEVEKHLLYGKETTL